MEKFTKLTGIAAPMPLVNIDTDMIIPKQFLKTIQRSGLGKNLFDEMRFDREGNEVADFVLNQPAYRKAEILVAGDNFGCGSSREHAVWAIYDYGFRCVVSSFFADIFKNNCLNIGVLPVTVSAEFADKLFAAIQADPSTEIEVNLPDQKIKLLSTGEFESFDINEYKKDNMQNGFDDIDYLLNMSSEIDAFAASR